MKPNLFFTLTLLSILSIPSTAFCQTGVQEEITLSTYYPAPYGEYDELCAEKVLVWRPDGQELADMSEGDCHIGGSLIVGAGGSGFSYDELDLAGATPLAQGTVLINGNVGIGTTGPGTALHISGTAPYLRLEGTASTGIELYESGASLGGLYTGNDDITLHAAAGHDIRFDDSTGTRVFIQEGGNVGIGTTTPASRLEVQGGPIRATGGLIIQTVANQTEEDALTPVQGQMWLRTDITP